MARGRQRLEFAQFLDRISNGAERPQDWHSFVVEHYLDEELETIRRSLSGMAIARNARGNPEWTDDDREQFRQWAAQLRD